MLGSSWFDMVVGVDLHFEMVPTPAPVPTPFPHPFIGLVFDPAGLAMGLALSNAIGMIGGGSFKGPVLINGLPATNTGTEAKNSLVLPHFVIPPGTAWTPMPKAPKPQPKPGAPPAPPDLPVAPANDAVLITGSKTVFSMGSNQCRLGDLAMSCAEPVRLPSSVLLPIPKGPPVLVGGPPAVDFMAAAMAFIKTKTIANELHGLVSRVKNQRLRNFLHWGVCTLTGHPVDVATGRVLTRETDYQLRGPLRLAFGRHYSSAWADRESPLGWGWSHTFDQAVWSERGRVVARLGDGREVEFDTFDLPGRRMSPGQEIWEPFSGLTLRYLDVDVWELEDEESRRYRFTPVAGDSTPSVARLRQIGDRAGTVTLLEYDAHGRLEWVRDGDGRFLHFVHDGNGRLCRVEVPHPTADGLVAHVRYEYDAAGDLVAVHDACGYTTRYAYAEHLLVHECDRAGMNYYFAYDGCTVDARCTRTWGDAAIYDRTIDYDPANRTTAVTDSLGATTLHRFNDLNMLVEKIGPQGETQTWKYDHHCRLLVEVDALGNATEYERDERGRITKVKTPDGEQEIRYDELGQPLEYRAPNDATRFEWDSLGRPRVIDDGQQRRVMHYHDGRLALEVRGHQRRLYEYDGHGQVKRVRTSAGPLELEYDRRGRLIARRDPLGFEQRWSYDACDRIVRIEDSSGRRRDFVRDGLGRPVEIHTATRKLELGWRADKLVEYRVDGHRTIFARDTEGRIAEIRNHADLMHRLRYDPSGHITEEQRFGGETFRYKCDALGRIVERKRPSGAVETMTYDSRGRTVEHAFEAGPTRRFRWGHEGLLEAATGEADTIALTHDERGRVVREATPESLVDLSFDDVGGDMMMRASSGFELRVNNYAPLARQLVASWAESQFVVTEVGRGPEVQRFYPGAVVSSTSFDWRGRPTSQRVWQDRTSVVDARWSWDEDDQLDEYLDQVTRHCIKLARSHDRRTQVARDGAGVDQWWRLDAAGNIHYRQDDHRAYDNGGRLLEDGEFSYEYDDDGRRTVKRGPDGTWRYEWDGAGMLTAVVKPDGSRTTFEYDALGRRVSKTDEQGTTRWSWLGNTPIHELGPTRRIAWVFEPGTFLPIALLDASGEVTSIVSDPQGTPVCAFSGFGKLVWKGEPDLHRGVRSTFREVEIPWRYPGQYEDVELGLVYNRYRYYDPSTGQYLSPDPLGVAGGMLVYSYAVDPLTESDPLGLSRGGSGCTSTADDQPPDSIMFRHNGRHIEVRVRVGDAKPRITSMTIPGDHELEEVLRSVGRNTSEADRLLRQQAAGSTAARWNDWPSRVGEGHTVGSSAREWTIRATNDEGRAAIAQMAEAQQNAIGHSGAYRQGDNSCLTHARDVWNSPFERSATRGGASNPYIPPNDMRTLDQFDQYMHNRFSGPGEGQLNAAGFEIVDRPWDLW